MLAKRLVRDAGTEATNQIQHAWRLVYSRLPEHSELESAVQFLRDQEKIFAEQPAYQLTGKNKPLRTPAQEALAVMCQMLFSSNEFLYVD